MREIKFRGSNTINGNWVYGYYYKKQGHNYIDAGHTVYPVHPPSIGQYTGLKDKNGVDIYEGDIVLAKDWNPNRYQIEFIEGGFCGTFSGCNMPVDINHFYDSTGCSIEITGNIYQNK